jgi:hypothetical protein
MPGWVSLWSLIPDEANVVLTESRQLEAAQPLKAHERYQEDKVKVARTSGKGYGAKKEVWGKT